MWLATCRFLFLVNIVSASVLMGGLPALDYSSLAEEARANSLEPIAVGGEERLFWNGNSVRFIYAPAFDFPESEGAVAYRFEAVNAGDGATYRFEAASPRAALVPIWGDMPVGRVNLMVMAIDGDGGETVVGERRFYKASPFAGPYHKPAMPYAESVKKGLEAFCNHPVVKVWAKTGEPHPDYVNYAYPSKMVSAIINATVRYHELTEDAEQRSLVLEIARGAAGWMLAHTEPAGSPLEHFPHTYWGNAKAAGKYGDEIMLLYPAIMGDAYLTLHGLTGDERYLEAAIRIARTYEKLQAADGSWPLKVRKETGEALSPNRTVDMRIPLFLERMAAYPGMAGLRPVARANIDYIERMAYRSFNWEGQFEDVEPTRPFENLTATSAAIFLRWKLEHTDGSPEAMAEAENLLRWIEDQFIVWENPPEQLFKWKTGKWLLPAGLEQYNWYLPIDAHSANFINTYLAAYRATGKALYLAKAVELANTLTVAQQRMDNLIPTYLYEPLTFDSVWLNCMVWAFEAIDALATELECR